MLLSCGAGETLESPLDWKEIKPVNPKGNQPRICIGRTDSKVKEIKPVNPKGNQPGIFIGRTDSKAKEIKPVNPKGNQPGIFIGRTDSKILILWPPDTKNQPTGKDHDAGKDWGQERGATEDEMVRKHHWLNGHEFKQTLGDSEGQRSLVCCSP